MISADIYYSYLELVLRQIDVFKLPEIWSPFSEEEENTWGVVVLWSPMQSVGT